MPKEWEVEYTDQFEEWWNDLDEDEQEDITASVNLLQMYGPMLPFPHSSGIKDSEYSRMRELRVQHKGRPYRIFYIFDPRRVAILLVGGDKTGDDSFYERHIPIADRLYKAHLKTLKKEGGGKDG